MGHRASNHHRCFFMLSVTAAPRQAEGPGPVEVPAHDRRHGRTATRGTYRPGCPAACCQPLPQRPRGGHNRRPAPRVPPHAKRSSPMSDAPSAALADQLSRTIAAEIGAQPAQARAAIGLLDEGATVPFIARYRKEVTGGLDDTQLRNLETRLTYLRELEDRRAAVLSSIEEQGKLTDALRGDIEAADSKARLEDLYLPYKIGRASCRERRQAA